MKSYKEIMDYVIILFKGSSFPGQIIKIEGCECRINVMKKIPCGKVWVGFCQISLTTPGIMLSISSNLYITPYNSTNYFVYVLYSHTTQEMILCTFYILMRAYNL